ncbi:MAG: LysM peptidoglycan-binding domain-containing protein [Kiritimatiellaeota bacterium]|nr:LysM peptidoglycan-binding domain-containing protein [Kiritimatiellota bacterium]
MKKTTFVSLACLVLAFVFVGCQPKLAESPYGAKEQHWEEFIKGAFPDWEPPQTVPPARQTRPASDVAPPNIVAEEQEPVIAVEPVVESGNVDAEVLETEDASAEFQTYTVRKGDTLWKIARRFYGSGKEWRKIYQANQDTMSDPNKVKAGSKIRIPAKQ